MHVPLDQQFCLKKSTIERLLKPSKTTLIISASLMAMSLGVVQPAFAQSLGDVAPPTRDELSGTSGLNAVRDEVTLTVDGQMERRPCALDNPEYDDLKINFDRVIYTGQELASDVSLTPAHEAYVGRELPIRALCDIRDRAAALLNDAGYLAAVEIPPQNLGDGTAEMRVVLGRLVAMRARGNTDGTEKLLSSYLGKLVGEDVFRVDRAERYLLLANDLPGTDVRLSLRPAPNGQPGDLIGEVAVLRRAYQADFSTHNYGSRALGRYSGLARGEVYNLTGFGDRTSISLYSTLDFKEQQTLQLAHDMRIGSEGLKIGGQLTLGWTRPDSLPGFDFKSDTVFASVEASFPFLRTQEASIWGAAGMDYLDQDFSFSGVGLTQDRIRTSYVRSNFEINDPMSIANRNGYSIFEPRYRVSGQVELRKGLSILGASEDCRPNFFLCTTAGAIPPSRIEQDPESLYIRGRLSTEYRPLPLVTLSMDLRGQFSNDPLPAFEEFSGGNFSIGRGFDPSSVLGDSGIGLGTELRYGSLRPKTEKSLVAQPYVFSDMVAAWQNDPSARANSPDSLWSVGGGVRAVYGNRIQGDFTIAVPVRSTNSQTELGDIRFLFSLTTRFSPWRTR